MGLRSAYTPVGVGIRGRKGLSHIDLEESVQDKDPAGLEVRLAERRDLPYLCGWFRVVQRRGATPAPEGRACFLSGFVLDGEEAATVIFETGLQTPMIRRFRDRFGGARGESVEKRLRFVAFVHLFDLAGEAQIHADEPGAAKLVRRAAFAFPEVELAELGRDDVRKAGAEALGRHWNLVKRDLADVSTAAEHV